MSMCEVGARLSPGLDGKAPPGQPFFTILAEGRNRGVKVHRRVRLS